MDFRSSNEITDLPLVTIGISSYNYSSYIIAALNSVLQQTYQHIEVIIIDDCSSDDCPQKISQWILQNKLHCTFIVNETNQGITKVSNQFVQLAKGKYLTLFATDDEMLPEKISLQVQLLENAGEEFTLVYANPIALNEQGKELGLFVDATKFKPQDGFVLKAWLQKEIVLVPPATLIRTSAYAKTGLYDERVLFEDYNFWLRLLAISKAIYCSYPCIKYRVKEQSAILNKWNDNKQERYFHDRILSHQLAFTFIKDAEVKQIIQKKTTQYLKAMADNKSSYLKQDVWLLLKAGYFKIPLKVLAKAMLN